MQHKVGFYVRVSTEEQALRNEGSLESQKHRLESFLDIKNMQTPDWGMLVDTYVDEVSAKDMRRPELQRLMADVRRGRVNLILVTDLSRLSRSIRDFCGLLDDLNKAKAKFLSLKEQFDTTTAAGEMMLFNMINLAQFERRQISERVSMNFHSRALRGLRNGGKVMLGYEVDPDNKARLHVCEKEADEVRLIFNTFLETGSSYRAAVKLRALGIEPKGAEGQQWTMQALRRVLRNYGYIGLREVNKANKGLNHDELKPHERYQQVKAAWPAIISETTFTTVQKVLDQNQAAERMRLDGSQRRVFYGSGFSVCGQCERPLVGSAAHGSARTIRYYVHRPLEGKPVTCSVKRFRADEIEEALLAHLATIVEDEGYLDGIEKTIASQQGNTVNMLEVKKRKLEQKIAKAEKDIRALIRVQLDSEGDPALSGIYADELKQLKATKDADVKTLTQIGSQLLEAPDSKTQRETIQERLRQLQAAWDKSPVLLRKRFLRMAIQRLVFWPDSIDIFYRSDEAATESGFSTDRSLEVINGGQSQEGSAAVASEYSIAGNKKPLNRLSNKAKVQGWYIGTIGSGGRI